MRKVPSVRVYAPVCAPVTYTVAPASGVPTSAAVTFPATAPIGSCAVTGSHAVAIAPAIPNAVTNARSRRRHPLALGEGSSRRNARITNLRVYSHNTVSRCPIGHNDTVRPLDSSGRWALFETDAEFRTTAQFRFPYSRFPIP